MTNGDRIRQMSNEELAKFLLNLQLGDDAVNCEGCIYYKTHHYDPADKQYMCEECYYKDIGEDVSKWLDKEEEKV